MSAKDACGGRDPQPGATGFGPRGRPEPSRVADAVSCKPWLVMVLPGVQEGWPYIVSSPGCKAVVAPRFAEVIDADDSGRWFALDLP
jgi:hypothetical protein